jgi:UDP-N-acetylmuramoylalanine--D-glutamate ligase
MSSTVLVLGLGLTGRAVAEALLRRGEDVRPVDDRPEGAVRRAVSELGLDLVAAPEAGEWPGLLAGCDRVVVSPGVPDAHPVFGAALQAGVVLLDESDLAADWDARPRCAVTGTDGKTTVVTLVAEMLERSGIRALPAGNNETPLVVAIDDAEAEVFVVEASSFRLGHARSVRLGPAAWLNFAPDHLDVHADLEAYEAAKARIWEAIEEPADAVANLSDPVVRSHAPEGATGFGTGAAACRVEHGHLLLGEHRIVAVDEMPRRMPHDLLNAQAATALATRAGALPEGCADVLRCFRGLPHRMQLLGEVDGIRFVDDSKATTPHATVSAVNALPGVVLIAGGRNKGLDLTPLGASAPRAVVAIGEAADEVVAAFTGRCPVVLADSMESAVAQARREVQGGGVVLLSPGCSSFDWYSSYAERGDDFARVVRELEQAR